MPGPLGIGLLEVVGGILGALIVIALYYFVLKPSGWRGLRIYYRLVGPLPGEELLGKLPEELGRRGVYARPVGSSVVVDEFVEWSLSPENVNNRSYLRVEATVKDWYVIVTGVMFFLGIIIGLLLAVLAAWRFYTRRDTLRAALTALTGDPTIASQL